MNSIATPRRNFFNRFAFARLLIPLRGDGDGDDDGERRIPSNTRASGNDKAVVVEET